MDPMDMLRQMGGVQSVAQELGVSEQEAQNGAAALIPAILGGFRNQVEGHSVGPAGLGSLLGRLGGGGLLDNVLSPQPTDVGRGNDVLGEIFGSKDVSRDVASHAAAQSGVNTSILKKMLPMVAMMVAGYMARQGGQASTGVRGGGLGSVLGGMLGGGNNPLAEILRNAGRR